MHNNARVAVITGASSGIGRATALQLAQKGYTVVLIARRRERLEALQKQIEHQTPGRALVEAISASDDTAVSHMAARVLDTVGVPEVIINSAGAGTWKFIEETSPQEARQMLDAPFWAAYYITSAFMQPMLSKRRGVIVHVGSPASVLPWPGATAYTVSRWALRGLHEALCQDLGGTGISSCHIVFGKVTSEYFEANPGSEEHIPSIARLLPVSSPETCARQIEKLLARPQRDVFYPPALRAYYWLYSAMPSLSRWVARSTGRQRNEKVPR